MQDSTGGDFKVVLETTAEMTEPVPEMVNLTLTVPASLEFFCSCFS